MTSDQLTAAQRAGAELFFGQHSSWGFALAVDTGRTEIFHAPGRFGGSGGLGTTAYTDPAKDMIGILFTQRMMFTASAEGIHRLLDIGLQRVAIAGAPTRRQGSSGASERRAAAPTQ